MNEHFIKDIEIKNFKCFENFKAEGFGRVNLIGGKNNVGKTAFMEACYLTNSKDTTELFKKLLEIETHRDLLNRLLSKTDRDEDIRELIKNNIGIEIFRQGTRGYENSEHNYNEWENGLIKIEYNKNIYIYTKFTKINCLNPIINGNEIIEQSPSHPDSFVPNKLIQDLSFNLKSSKMNFSLNFISPYSNSNEELENIIGQSKLDNKYDTLNKYLLNVFNISSIDIIKNKPMLKSNGEYEALSLFGQGIKTFINIISSILLLKDDMIFIDEIENGIHYSNLDKLWEIILSLSKEQNVQVFATTHSKECIESYARVAKRLEEKDEDITYTYLTRLKDNSLYASIYTKDILETAIQQEHEVR